MDPEQQKLISQPNGRGSDGVQRSEEETSYGALRCYGDSDTERSSEVIYLPIGEKKYDEEESRGFTQSSISDPVKREELSAKRANLSRPYECLQVLVGWQPVVQLMPYQDRRQLRLLWKLVNFLYPALIFALLLMAFFLQYASCYMINIDINQKINLSSYMDAYCVSGMPTQSSVVIPLRCQEPVIGAYILPGVLNLIFYLYSLILNRFVESEQLPAMIEKVTLQCSSRHFAGYRSQSGMVHSLARFYYLGILWIVLACLLPVLFTVSEYLTLHGINFTILKTCYAGNIALIALMTVGFIVVYLSYTAMLTNYVTQCQLMIYLLLGLLERIEDANVELPDTAISMVNDAAKLLRVVNGHTASCMSLLITILGLDAVLFVVALSNGTISSLEPVMSAPYLIGVILVIAFIAISLIQAGRLTAACNRLKRLGHNVRARPLGYHDTTQDALDSFLLYLSTLSIKAKICRVPVTSSLLLPISTISLLVVVLLFELNVFQPL